MTVDAPADAVATTGARAIHAAHSALSAGLDDATEEQYAVTTPRHSGDGVSFTDSVSPETEHAALPQGHVVSEAEHAKGHTNDAGR